MRALVLLALLAAGTASAQPFNWSLPTSGSTISLSAERPLFDGPFRGVDLGPLASAWLFSTTQAVGPVRLTGELPFAYGSAEPDFGGDDVGGFALGNAQVGAEADLLAAPVTVGGYVRLPTATAGGDGGEVGALVGLFSDRDRPGLYIEDLVTVSAMVEARPRVLAVPGLSFRLRAVPQLLIATDDFVLADGSELLVGYAAQAFFSTGAARVGGGLSGASIVTEDVDDRHEVSLGVLADAGLGATRVGVVGRLPVAGGASDVVNGVIGLRLTYGVD